MSIRLIAWLLLLFAVPACAGNPAAAFRADGGAQGKAALALARAAMQYACRTHAPLPLPADLPPLLRQRAAVFVSAMDPHTGAPRCCMGTLRPREATLAAEIISNAYMAAVCDKRFPPLKRRELDSLQIIISIIGETHPISDPATLDPVRDGLAVCGPRDTGVVLPGETADAKTMLAWGRTRAGLSPHDTTSYLAIDAVRYMEPVTRKDDKS